MTSEEKFGAYVLISVLIAISAMICFGVYFHHLETMARIGKHCTEAAK